MACVTVPAATAEMELAFSLRPGFRFHPTDQELVNFFLRRMVVLGHGGFIPEVDLYRFEPDELPGKSFSPSTGDPGAKVEWYLFAQRGRKYPTGLRMERATMKGFWKSTGKDRPVMHNSIIVGMKKTLVFHIGRAPSGTRTDWVMHEYRLHGHHNHHIQDTYALCRVFNKNTVSPSTNLSGDAGTYESESDGADANNDLMQSVLSGVGTDMDPIQVESESDGANENKDLMLYTLGGGGTDKDPIHVEFMSDDADTDKDMMQFVFGDVGTDKIPIQIESEVDGVDTDKGDKQFPTDADDTGNGEMQILTGGANQDKEGMQHVTGGANTDEDNSDNSWYTRYLAEEDNSWMQFPSDDVWYTSVDMWMIP